MRTKTPPPAEEEDPYENDDWDQSDDDGFGEKQQPKKNDEQAAKKVDKDQEYEDMLDEYDFDSKKKNDEQAAKAKKEKDMWFQDGYKDKKEDDFIDEIPSIPTQNAGPGVKPKETDFNKLVGNEKGGLLASMGVSKEETRAAANQMSEYESEDDYAQEFEQAKKLQAKNAEPQDVQ